MWVSPRSCGRSNGSTPFDTTQVTISSSLSCLALHSCKMPKWQSWTNKLLGKNVWSQNLILTTHLDNDHGKYNVRGCTNRLVLSFVLHSLPKPSTLSECIVRQYLTSLLMLGMMQPPAICTLLYHNNVYGSPFLCPPTL
jgi:hypothetical protein